LFRDASIGHDNVDGAALLVYFLERGSLVLPRGHITFSECHFCVWELVGQLACDPRTGFLVDVEDSDGVALGSKVPGHGQADAASAAGDDDRFPSAHGDVAALMPLL